MKKILLLTTISLLALPLTTGALTVRTDHRSSSGGVTAAEGSATVTGDENSSVNVQTIISGSHGTVQVTTEKDGVTTTETHTIDGSGSGGTVIVTPPPPADNSSGRTPRGDRGTVAVAQTSVQPAAGSNNNNSIHVQVTADAKGKTVHSVTQSSKRIQSSVLAIAHTGQAASHAFDDMPMPVIHMAGTPAVPNAFAHFFSKIFSIFGIGV